MRLPVLVGKGCINSRIELLRPIAENWYQHGRLLKLFDNLVQKEIVAGELVIAPDLSFRANPHTEHGFKRLMKPAHPAFVCRRQLLWCREKRAKM